MILQPGKGKHDTTVQIAGSVAHQKAREDTSESKGKSQEQPKTSATGLEPGGPEAPAVAQSETPAPAPKTDPLGPDSQKLLENSPIKPAPAPSLVSNVKKNSRQRASHRCSAAGVKPGGDFPPLAAHEISGPRWWGASGTLAVDRVAFPQPSREQGSGACPAAHGTGRRRSEARNVTGRHSSSHACPRPDDRSTRSGT